MVPLDSCKLKTIKAKNGLARPFLNGVIGIWGLFDMQRNPSYKITLKMASSICRLKVCPPISHLILFLILIHSKECLLQDYNLIFIVLITFAPNVWSASLYVYSKASPVEVSQASCQVSAAADLLLSRPLSLWIPAVMTQNGWCQFENSGKALYANQSAYDINVTELSDRALGLSDSQQVPLGVCKAERKRLHLCQCQFGGVRQQLWK